MEQILKEDDIIGKTIKSNGYGDNAFCLVFTDNTYCIIKGSGYDENDVEFSDEGISLKPTLWNAEYLVAMGLVSNDEAEEAKRNEELENEQKEKEKEYKQYLKLKMKFG